MLNFTPDSLVSCSTAMGTVTSHCRTTDSTSEADSAKLVAQKKPPQRQVRVAPMVGRAVQQHVHSQVRAFGPKSQHSGKLEEGSTKVDAEKLADDQNEKMEEVGERNKEEAKEEKEVVQQSTNAENPADDTGW